MIYYILTAVVTALVVSCYWIFVFCRILLTLSDAGDTIKIKGKQYFLLTKD